MANDWILEIIKEFVCAESIRTTPGQIQELYNYYISQGYSESLGIVCAALIADSKTLEILTA